MGRKRRFPITSHMVKQSLHVVIVRAGENNADSGGTNLRIRRAVVIDSAAVVEKAVQWAVEVDIELKGGGRPVTVRIEDLGAYASVPRSRIDAAMRGYLSVEIIRKVAAKCGLTALTRWLDAGGERWLRAMLGQRHAYVHSLSLSIPLDIRACRTADAVLFAVLDGHTIE